MEKYPSNNRDRRNRERGAKNVRHNGDNRQNAGLASDSRKNSGKASDNRKDAGAASVPVNVPSKINWVNFGLTAAFILFAFWILAVKNGFMLRWYDEMSLFEPNMLFFKRLLYYPGGLLRYAGTFLTQFMYYPYLGTAIIISLWLLLAYLVKVDFGFKGKAYPLTLLLPLCLLISLVQIDEAWLSLKSEGLVFFPTLGYLFTLGSYWVFLKSMKIPWLSFIITAIIIFCYAIAGFYALLAGALCIIKYLFGCFRLNSTGKDVKTGNNFLRILFLVEATLSILILWCVPKLYFIYVNGNTVDNEYLYLKGLPELMMEKFDIYLWQPVIAGVIIAIAYGFLKGIDYKKLTKSVLVMWLGVIGCIALSVWCVKAERKSEQLRATVLMLDHIDKKEWSQVCNVLSLIQEPANYTMLKLNNVALAHLGGEEKNVESMKPMNIDARHAESFSSTAFVNVPVFYYTGYPNVSYRWAMEHTVQYGRRVFYLKYMIKDALVRGEIRLAGKYNDMLMSTLFHRKWAKEMNKYIENPSLIQTDEEFSDIIRKMNP